MKYVVISRDDSTTLGPFDSEEAATKWAKTIKWRQGFFIRAVHPVTVTLN